jgi:hypothetical protein
LDIRWMDNERQDQAQRVDNDMTFASVDFLSSVVTTLATYLRDVLERLPTLPKERVSELLPDRWTPANATGTTAEAVAPGLLRPGNETRL